MVILDVPPRTKGFRRNPITTFGIGHTPLPPRKRHETQPRRCPVRKKEIKFSVSSWFSSIFATYRREETDSGKETRNCVSMMKCATVDIVDDLPPRLKRENISRSRQYFFQSFGNAKFIRFAAPAERFIARLCTWQSFNDVA